MCFFFTGSKSLALSIWSSWDQATMAMATCHLRLGLFATTSRHSRCQETSTTMPQAEFTGKQTTEEALQAFQNQNEILSPGQGQGKQNEATSFPTFRASDIITPTPIRSCNRSWIFNHGTGNCTPKTLITYDRTSQRAHQPSASAARQWRIHTGCARCTKCSHLGIQHRGKGSILHKLHICYFM